jgi:alkyl sulfatase BDS1-like metallo-beta-lactamase superfamily hydrolase
MEVMFASHSWPRWGNARIQEVLRAQRDLYANMNNQVLHLANQGVTVNEIHNVYRSPPPSKTVGSTELSRLRGGQQSRHHQPLHWLLGR